MRQLRPTPCPFHLLHQPVVLPLVSKAICEPGGRSSRNARNTSRSCPTRIARPYSPSSFIATNKENFLCASHPINCSIVRRSSFQGWVLPTLRQNPAAALS